MQFALGALISKVCHIAQVFFFFQGGKNENSKPI